MRLAHAQLISELLTNWIDDTIELIGDIKDNEGRIRAIEKAQDVDSLIDEINLVLPNDQQVVQRRRVVDYID